MREGLKPRGLTGRSNYKAQSHPQAVYLTDAYAPYFAFNTVDKDFANGQAVLVIDTDKLDLMFLAPDEDALEQASRVASNGRPPKSGSIADHAAYINPKIGALDMAQRTRFFRGRQFYFAAQGFDHFWSLAALGTCCYHGVIPPTAIVKIIEWPGDRKTTMEMALTFDPQISLINYRLCGSQYRYLMQEFAGVDTGYTIAPGDAQWSLRTDRLAYIREIFARMKHVSMAEA